MSMVEGTFPLEIWHQITVALPQLYGRIVRLSRRHRASLRGDLEHFKRAACRLVSPRPDVQYWVLPNGQHHGVSTSYYGTGDKFCEEIWADGKLHGKSITYYITSVKRVECDYVNDKLHGKRIVYYDTGHVYLEIEYVKGKCIDPFMNNDLVT